MRRTGVVMIDEYNRYKVIKGVDAARKDGQWVEKGGDHFGNFLTAVRSRKKEDLHGPVETAHYSSSIAHLGNISYRLGRRLKFDPATAGSCSTTGCSLIGNTGAWSIEALGQSSFNFGVDGSNAHVQPDGAYHYHGMPEGVLLKAGKGTAMTLVGFALDGFPVYARYGYSVATDASSAIKVLRASYRTKSSPDSGRPATTTYAMGTFTQDWEYVAGLGDLDDCNGRFGVTPEYPNGIYHYVITDTYPYIQRCLRGTATASTTPGAPPPR